LVSSIKTSETCGGRGNSVPTRGHFVTCSVYRKSRWAIFGSYSK
jgi:hypothetical protein